MTTKEPTVFTPLDTCQAQVHSDSGDWYGHKCGRKAFALGNDKGKEVPLCKTHHPYYQEQRRITRGPTRWQRDLDLRLRMLRQAALVPDLVSALESLRGHGTMFDIFRDDIGQTVLKQVETALSKAKGTDL